MLGFTDEVTRINKFLRWSLSIERYLLFNKFMMETVFSHMYVDPNLQQCRRAMSGRAGNRDGRRYIHGIVNSWLSAFKLYRVCQNSPYRLWGLVVETKTIKFIIGTRVRKRTAFPIHAKSPHTLFSAPLTGIVLTRVVHTSFPDHLMSHSTTRLFTCYSVARPSFAVQ